MVFTNRTTYILYLSDHRYIEANCSQRYPPPATRIQLGRDRNNQWKTTKEPPKNHQGNPNEMRRL